MRRPRIVLALALTGALAAPVGAQSCTIPPATDSVTLVVHGTLAPFDERAPLPAGYAEAFLREFASRLLVPIPPPVTVYQQLDTTTAARMLDSAWGSPAVRMLAGIRVVGRSARSLRLMASSLSASMDVAFLSVIQEMAADSAMPALPRNEEIEARLSISTGPNVPRGAVELFRYRAPRVMLTAATIARHRAPEYPMELRRERVEGRVLLEFVVSDRGMAEIHSVRVRRADDPRFIKPGLEALRGFTFHPARAAGCPVPQLVWLPYAFQLQR